MPSEQIAIRLPEALLEVLDGLVERGVYDSRAAAVREGIELVVELDRRRQKDAAIIEGYRRHPPSSGDEDAAWASMRDAIAEEPW